MSAVELLQKAVRLDTDGRMLEALKLYQSGIDELLKVCKSEFLNNKSTISSSYLFKFS